MDKDSKINIGVLGGFQNGKSTFVNCLLDDMVAKTGGYGLSVTSVNAIYQYGNVQNVAYISNESIIDNSNLTDYQKSEKYPEGTQKITVSLWKPILNNISIIDTPGFNANEKDTNMAISSFSEMDIAILIIDNKDISSTELQILNLLKEHHTPFIVIMNCKYYDGISWTPNSEFNERIAKNNLAKIHAQGLYPIAVQNEEIWQTNLLWFWYASEHYLKESEDKQRNYTKMIKYYYEENVNTNSSLKDYCLNESNFLPLRKFFTEDSLWNTFPLTMARWRKAIDYVFEDWGNKINK